MSSLDFVRKSLNESAQNLAQLSSHPQMSELILKASDWICESFRNKGKLLIAGNGGSAADAQHISAELVAKLSRDRTSIPALSLCVDSSLVTAIGNDYGYDYVYERQLQGLAQPQDVFLAITTSGNSKNILNALERCRSMKIKSILLTGFEGGKAKELADLTLVAPGAHTAQIQESHVAIYHCLCFLVEKTLIDSGHIKYF